MIVDQDLEIFADCFICDGHSRARCECGMTYYNSIGGWSWEEGELEKLGRDPNAIDLDHTIGSVSFEGKTYCYDCDCWHGRAKMIIGFVNSHLYQLSGYINAKKQLAIEQANALPEVK